MAKKPYTEENAFNWLHQPGIFCDDYAANWFRGGFVRIAFAEYTTQDYWPIYRTGVVMPLADARRLGRTLLRLVREAEAEAAKELEEKQKTKGKSDSGTDESEPEPQ